MDSALTGNHSEQLRFHQGVDVLTEEAFVRGHAAAWHALEENLKQGVPHDFEAMTRRSALRRGVTRHLSYAQTHFPDSEVCRYLNTLAGKAHVDAERKRRARRNPARFFLRDIPKTVLAGKAFWLTAIGLFGLAFLYAYLFVHFSPSSAGAFLPPEYLSAGVNPGGGSAYWDGTVMSSGIMVNNIMVSIMAFAYGITLGLGTLYVLVQNGLMLGGLAALVTDAGHGTLFWSLILPHGVFELFSIFLSAGAGLSIGYAFMRPAPYTRGDALKKNARAAMKQLVLVCVLLVVAGLIEGFFTPSDLPVWSKFVFSGVCALILIAYLLGSRGEKRSPAASP